MRSAFITTNATDMTVTLHCIVEGKTILTRLCSDLDQAISCLTVWMKTGELMIPWKDIQAKESNEQK